MSFNGFLGPSTLPTSLTWVFVAGDTTSCRVPTRGVAGHSKLEQGECSGREEYTHMGVFVSVTVDFVRISSHSVVT